MIFAILPHPFRHCAFGVIDILNLSNVHTYLFFVFRKLSTKLSIAKKCILLSVVSRRLSRQILPVATARQTRPFNFLRMTVSVLHFCPSNTTYHLTHSQSVVNSDFPFLYLTTVHTTSYRSHRRGILDHRPSTSLCSTVYL